MSDEIQKIKDHAFNLLSYRDRSCKELKDRLLEKGFEENNVDSVIERLEELGYINDKDFAYKWVRYRIKHKPRGKNLLKKELFSKGINDKIINKTINKLLDDELEIKIGISIAKKWLTSHEKDLDKLRRYLYYKGFARNIIYSIENQMEIKNLSDF